MTSDNSYSHSQIKISFGSEAHDTSYKQKRPITEVKFECYFKMPTAAVTHSSKSTQNLFIFYYYF